MDLVLYTALYGTAEPLNPDVFGGFGGCRRVLVTDRPGLQIPGVETIVDPAPGLDPVRASRRSKLMPQRLFGDAAWSVYVDNKSRLLRPPQDILAAVRAQSDADFFAFPHFRRDCVYQEGRTVMENGLDDHRIVAPLMRRYRAEGMPEHAGLIEGHFLVRRHTDNVAQFGAAWFDQVCRFSRRDQLSFPYLAWKSGFRYDLITALQRSDTVQLTVFDRAGRRPDFPRRHRAYQWLRSAYHAAQRGF